MRRYLALLPAYVLQAVAPLALSVAWNFEYEYVLLAAYATLLLVPLTALLLPRKDLPLEDGVYSPPYAFEFVWVMLLGPALVAGICSGLYALTKCMCSGPGLVFWMAMIWYPAWVLAHACAHGIWLLRCRGEGRGFASVLVVTIYVALTTHAALVLWFAPPKRLQHLLTGFWHGPIYDSYIAVDNGVIYGQLANLFAAVLLLLLVWLRRTTLSVSAVMVIALVWGFCAFKAGEYPSSQNSRGALEAVLNGTVSGPGFVVHYQKPSGTGDVDPPASVQHLVRDTAFHIGELKRRLATTTDDVFPLVQIYVYPDNDTKKLWFGGGATDVTDVRIPAIHVTADQWPHPTLRHELVHALASGLAFHGLGFHPNMAFTEGLAVALAPAPSSITLDDGAAAIIESGRLPDVESLFSPYFWTLSGDRAYTVAGSFISFLEKSRGMAVVKGLYAGQDFQKVMGEAKGQVVEAWKKQILASFDKANYALYSEALYRSPGVLHARCPHSKADLARQRDESVFTRMRQPLGWDPESDYLPWLNRLNPQDREAQVRQWRQEAARLATERVPKLSDIKDLRDKLAEARKVPATTVEDIEIGILEADLAAILGDRSGSIKILVSLQQESKNRYLGDGLTREINARLTVEQNPTVPTPLEWRRYLATWRKTLPFGGEQEAWLITYLKLRSPRSAPATVAQLKHMLSALPPDPNLPRTFAQEWYRILAEKLMDQNEFQAAALAYEKAADAARPGMRPILQEHARRVASYGGSPLL